ncbi:MAG: hypothetical protein EOP43_04140 [Sphingobacteriaceae bacterium]|nr:MAG: hypothetical protein EOP43_04140 [Sphingobacteriaceae bacterium]
MIKLLLTGIFSFTALLCSAQKQLLTYQDLQSILQTQPAAVASFMQQKDYHLHPAANNEIRYLTIYADNDYADILLKTDGKHHTLTVLTTHLEQVKLIQNSLEAYSFKNSKGTKIYRIKDSGVSKVILSENEPQTNANKVYIIELEN